MTDNLLAEELLKLFKKESLSIADIIYVDIFYKLEEISPVQKLFAIKNLLISNKLNITNDLKIIIKK